MVRVDAVVNSHNDRSAPTAEARNIAKKAKCHIYLPKNEITLYHSLSHHFQHLVGQPIMVSR